VIKRFAPAGLILAVACGGGDGDGGIGPIPNPHDISSMNVGEVRVLNPSDIPNGIDLPAGSGARDYVIIVANTSSARDVVANYVVRADRSTDADFGISAAPDLSVQSSKAIDRIPLARTPQQAIDNKVRAFERRNLSLRSTSGPVGGSRFSARRSTRVGSASVPPNVGDKIPLKIPDAQSDNLCENYFDTQAEVASVSARAILAVDTIDGPPALLFTPAQMDSITAEFDNVTYPTNAAYFANPTDIDANQRIIILFTGRVNQLTPPNQPSGSGFVGGFFFAGDFFPPTGTVPNTFCPQSNEAEIFYLLSPDPTGKWGNIRTTASVRQGTRGTIAHEMHHMINAGNRYQNPAVSEFESTWLDEALAHMGEDAVGRVQRGFADLHTLTFAELVPCNTPCSQANDFNAFFFQNLARLTYWMQDPDLYSPTSRLADTSLATRGAAWAIVRYVADNYSNGLPRTLTRTLTAGPDTGVRNFTAAVNAPLDTVVSGWLVSMFADHLGIPGLNARYQYRSYNFRDVMPPVAKSVLQYSGPATYPLAIEAIGSGSDNLPATNRSGSGTYYRLTTNASSGAKNVKILDPSGNPANYPGEHIYVLRIQ
jgi:hypothetical protein